MTPETTKKKIPKQIGKPTSIQFDKNGIPIYMFTDAGIFHVEFKEMEKDIMPNEGMDYENR